MSAPLTARSQQIWAAAINEAKPVRRLLAAAVGITTRMLGRHLGGSSPIDDDLARRIAEAAGLVVVPVTDTGFIMTKKTERFDPGLHAHVTITATFVPLAKPYPHGKARVFGELLELRGDQPSPPDESQASAYPAKWPEDDLRAVAVALVDELERRGRHEDSEQVARLVTGTGLPVDEESKPVESAVYLERSQAVLEREGFQFGQGVWKRPGVCEAISAWGGEVWIDSETAISTNALRALAVVADHTAPPDDEEDRQRKPATWAPFWFEGNEAWGLIATANEWNRIRAAYSRTHCNHIDLNAARRGPDKPGNVPNFGLRGEHQGTETLADHFNTHGMASLVEPAADPGKVTN